MTKKTCEIDQFLANYGIFSPPELKFWQAKLVDYHKGRSKAAFFDLSSRESTLKKIALAENPKPGKEKSGDVILLKRAPQGIFIFCGDGVTPAAYPTELAPLLQQYQCEKNPDALPGILLRQFVERAYFFSPFSFLELAESYLNLRYQECLRTQGLDISQTPNSHLPAIVGIPIFIQTEKIDFAIFGDPVAWSQDPTHVYFNLTPCQNTGFDAFTVNKIREIMTSHPGMTVKEAKQTPEFKKWVAFTYDNKVNVQGGVSVINGKNFARKSVLHSSLPFGWVEYAVFSTDGLTLGKNPAMTRIETLKKATTAKSLAQTAEKIVQKQAYGFNQSYCTQEKENDDLAAVQIILSNPLVTTKFAPFITQKVKKLGD